MIGTSCASLCLACDCDCLIAIVVNSNRLPKVFLAIIGHVDFDDVKLVAVGTTGFGVLQIHGGTACLLLSIDEREPVAFVLKITRQLFDGWRQAAWPSSLLSVASAAARACCAVALSSASQLSWILCASCARPAMRGSFARGQGQGRSQRYESNSFGALTKGALACSIVKIPGGLPTTLALAAPRVTMSHCLNSDSQRENDVSEGKKPTFLSGSVYGFTDCGTCLILGRRAPIFRSFGFAYGSMQTQRYLLAIKITGIAAS